MAQDSGRIKSNIESMIAQGASEDEIDTYVASEGTSPEQLQTAQMAPAPVGPNEALQSMIADPKVPIEDLEKFVVNGGFDLGSNAPALKAYAEWKRTPEGVAYKGPQGNIELPQAPPPASPTEVPAMNDGINASFLEGLIPNLSNNVRGVGGVIGNGLRTIFDGDEWAPGEAFQNQYDKATADDIAFEEAHPTIDNISALTGFGAGFALPATKLMQGAKAPVGALKSGVVNGAATGAAYGGLTGLLNPTGAGRLENAAWGTAGGGTIGGIAAPIVRAGTGVSGWTRDHIPGIAKAYTGASGFLAKMRGQLPDVPLPQREAQRRMAAEMKPATINTGMGTGTEPVNAQSMTDEITRRQDLGTKAIPGDTSEKLRTLTSWALSGRGPMATRARTMLESRQANQGTRVRESLQAEMGQAVDPVQSSRDIAARASAEAKPNYQQAYSEGVVITPEIQQAMQTPVFQQGLRQAYENIKNRGGNPAELGMFMDEAGELTLGNAPTLEAMDQVIRTIRGDVKRDAFGRAMTDTKTGAEQAAAGNLDTLLRSQNQSYDIAKSTFADDMAIKDAMERGGKVGNLTGHEINAQASDMPQHAQEAWMTGANTALSDKAVKVGQFPTVNVTRAIRKDLGLSAAGREASDGDAVKTAAIEAMSGKPGLLNRVDDRLEVEDQSYKTFNEVFGGSKTFQKQADNDAMLSGITRAGRDVLMGAPAVAIAGLFFKTLPASAQKFRTEVQENIASVLTETNPANIQEAFKAIEARAAKDDSFKAVLNKAGIQLSRLSASALGGSDGDPFVPQE